MVIMSQAIGCSADGGGNAPSYDTGQLMVIRRLPMVSGLILSRNGNAITLDKRFYDQGVRSLQDFKAAIAKDP